MYKADEIDKLVKEIAQKHTKPIIDASIDQIADEIEARGMKRPAKNSIWLALKRIGAVASGKKFIYTHNGGRHE